MLIKFDNELTTDPVLRKTLLVLYTQRIQGFIPHADYSIAQDELGQITLEFRDPQEAMLFMMRYPHDDAKFAK